LRTALSSTVLIAAIALLYGVHAAGAAPLGESTWLCTPLLLGVAMWAAVSRRLAWAVKALTFAPLALFGKISYSFYLYHLPVLILFNKYLAGTPPLLAFPLYLAVMLPLAWASFHFIEEPFMRWRQREVSHA
jgi:peptidoglycan/LPS O-acetylase OafA/YrhL